jgi:hypothetical protein
VTTRSLPFSADRSGLTDGETDEETTSLTAGAT